MATLADLVQRTRNELYGAFPTEAPFVTQLASSYTSGATTIVVLEEDNWVVNDIVENLSTGEQMLVTAVTTNDTDTLTVIRGWNGTTAAASSGTNDTLLKNPRFTYSQIEQAIYDTQGYFESWGIHGFSQSSTTRADPKEFYEISATDVAEPYGVLMVFEVENQTEVPRALPFRYQRKLGTGPSEYSQGQGIYVLDWGNIVDGGSFHFIYAQKITPDSTGSGRLLERQEKLVVTGATALLLGATIIPATHDPGARTDRTVQPGQTGRDWRNIQARFISEARMETALLHTERQRFLNETPKLARARRWRS